LGRAGLIVTASGSLVAWTVFAYWAGRRAFASASS
jgi:hypothetical protein